MNYLNDIDPSEITPEELYLNRRQFMTRTAGTLIAGSLPGLVLPKEAVAEQELTFTKNSQLSTQEKLTDYDDATNYCNFYEYTTAKEGVAAKAKILRTRPWHIKVEGHVQEPQTFNVYELIKNFPLEERIYRLRCVEAWSMVIPWIGFPLSKLIELCQPTAEATFVEFTTLYDKKQMPGQNWGTLAWPYVEGLRMDEAMHPLTILAVGMYGKSLPKQNGAPIRLVVPWKYGIKYIKSIVKIRFVDKMVQTSWMRTKADEYGFYSNVNPDVDHPRWSQKKERRIGEWKKRKTLMFNGYGDQVAHLYDGMDLVKNF